MLLASVLFNTVEDRSWWVSFWLLFFYRYSRLVVNVVANLLYRPVPIPDQPTFTSGDVTTILPTVPPGEGDLSDFEQTLQQTVRSVCAIQPEQLIVVTTHKHLAKIKSIVESVNVPGPERIRVLSVETPNKRNQIVRALPEVQTRLTLLIDDDVKIPLRFLPWVLAPFEQEGVGGVGTNQRLARGDNTNKWNFLGASYLLRRNFDCTACNWLDGGLPCLSGRAVMYRTGILQDQKFKQQFANETWSFMGTKYHLNVDDDNFITRWLFAEKKSIKFQSHPECEVETTLQPDRTFLKQCVRWQRSNWRSNMTSLFSERNVWRLFPWSTYAVFLTTLTQWAAPIDASLLYLLHRATRSWELQNIRIAFVLLVSWWLVSRYVKYYGFFWRNPEFLRFALLIPLFGYFHNLIKLYSLFTIHETAWGNREDADSVESRNERLRRRHTFDSCISDEEKALFYESHIRRRRSPELISHEQKALPPEKEAQQSPPPVGCSNDYLRLPHYHDVPSISVPISSAIAVA